MGFLRLESVLLVILARLAPWAVFNYIALVALKQPFIVWTETDEARLVQRVRLRLWCAAAGAAGSGVLALSLLLTAGLPPGTGG